MDEHDASEPLGPIPGELSRNQRRQVARARKRTEAMTAEAARVAEEAARAVNAAHAVERGAVAVARRAEHTAVPAPLAPLGTGREIAPVAGRGRGRGRGGGRERGRGRGDAGPNRLGGRSHAIRRGGGGGSRLESAADSASAAVGGHQPSPGLSGSGRVGACGATPTPPNRQPAVPSTRSYEPAPGGDRTQSASQVIAIINDGRRVLTGRVGGLTASQQRMLLSALELAGPDWLPSLVQMQILSQCRGGCGDVEAIDSLMASAVSILQNDGGGLPSPADTTAASFFVRQALASHACKGQCLGGVQRSLPLASRPARSPAPSFALPPAPILNARAFPRAPPPNAPAASSTRRPPRGRPLPPPAKRLHRTTSHDGDPQSVATVTTFAPRTPRGAPSLPMAPGASDGLGDLPGAVEPVVPLFFFPARAERRLQLSTANIGSLAAGEEISKRMMDGLLLWLLYWADSGGVHGGLRVLSALDAEDVKDAVTDDSLIVNRAAKVLRDRLVFGGGTVIMPVYSGQGWSGLVVRQLHLVVSSVVQAVIGRDAASVHGAAVVLINTCETRGGAQVDFDIVNGLFRSLSAAMCQTHLRTRDSLGMRMRVNWCLRMRLPVRRVAIPGGDVSETADHLLAHLSLLHSAKPPAAAHLLRPDDGPQWKKAHAPRRLRGLVRRIVDAHRPGGEIFLEQEPGGELLSGYDLSEDEAADGEEALNDMTDDEDGSGDNSVHYGSRKGDSSGGMRRTHDGDSVGDGGGGMDNRNGRGPADGIEHGCRTDAHLVLGGSPQGRSKIVPRGGIGDAQGPGGGSAATHALGGAVVSVNDHDRRDNGGCRRDG